MCRPDFEKRGVHRAETFEARDGEEGPVNPRAPETETRNVAATLKSIKARLVVALLLTLTVTLAMASLLYFGARSLEKNAQLTGAANEEVRDLLGFATAAHRYMNGFGQSLGQRTVVANNERRLAAEAFEARIATIGAKQRRGLVSSLPWDDLRTISSDLSRKLQSADALRAQGKFEEAERLFNLARKTDFDQRMLPWFDAAIASQRTQVERLEADAVSQAKTLRVAGNVLGGVSAVLITLVVFATLLAIVRPVRLLVEG